MSAASAIMRKGRSITLRRYAAGAYVNGFFQAGASTDTQITVSVQPMGDQERMLMPEGDRTRQWIKGYTVADVRTMVEGGSRADQLVVDGLVYDVMKVQDWFLPGSGANLTHKRIAAVRVNEKTDSP